MAILGRITVAVCAIAVLVAAGPMNVTRGLHVVTIMINATDDISILLMPDPNLLCPNEGSSATTLATEVKALPTSSSPISIAPSATQEVEITLPSVALSPPSTSSARVHVSPFFSTTPNFTAEAYPSSGVVVVAPSVATASAVVNSNASVTYINDKCDSSADVCKGDITHWDGGLGACGWNVDTSSDYAVALPYDFMGTLSNSNPFCNRSLTIQNPDTGARVQAIVADKCMGCVGRSIDLTDKLFNAIAPTCDGRCHNFVWWFN